MQFQLDNDEQQNTIRSYQPGQILINDHSFNTPVIITASHIITDQLPKSIHTINELHIAEFARLSVEIWLLGSGEKSEWLSPQQEAWAEKHHCYFDCMSSSAACRTYAVLTAEQRSVAVLLFP